MGFMPVLSASKLVWPGGDKIQQQQLYVVCVYYCQNVTQNRSGPNVKHSISMGLFKKVVTHWY